MGGTLSLSALAMITVLLPQIKKVYKLKTETEAQIEMEQAPVQDPLKTEVSKTSEAQMEMEQAPVQGHNHSERKNTEINFTILWSEIVNWNKNIKKQESRKAILLGLLPSVLDVTSDYSYARTWTEQGFGPQIRALVFFFICLPHVVTFLTGILRILTSSTFSCSGSRLALRILSRTIAMFLFLSLLVGFISGALHLGWHHPDVFAYFAAVSAVITVGLKTVSVLVQGPEMKRAMALVNAR